MQKFLSLITLKGRVRAHLVVGSLLITLGLILGLQPLVQASDEDATGSGTGVLPVRCSSGRSGCSDGSALSPTCAADSSAAGGA